MANPPRQPDIESMNAAIEGMAVLSSNIVRDVQTFTDHQQALGAELSMLGNLPVAQIQQQLVTMQADIRQLMALCAAR
jgi:hypothetical protein